MERHVARAKGTLSKGNVSTAAGQTAKESGVGVGVGVESSLPSSSGADGSLSHSQSTPAVQVSKSVFAAPRTPVKDLSRRSAVLSRPTAEEEDLPRRERDFLFYFGYLKEKLIDHTSCACQGEDDMLVRHGRIFITENHICFSSHIIGEYLKEIPFGEVQQIAKKNTAFVVPNAISVKHSNGTEFFSSMSGRDRIFDLLNTLWHKKQGEKSLGINLKSLTESALMESAKKQHSSEAAAVPADNPFHTPGKNEGKQAPAIVVSAPGEGQISEGKASKAPMERSEKESSGKTGKNSKPLDLSVFKSSIGAGDENSDGKPLRSPRVTPRITVTPSEAETDVKKEAKESHNSSDGMAGENGGDNGGAGDWVEGRKVNFTGGSLRGSGLAIGGKTLAQMGKLPTCGEYEGHLQLPEKTGTEQQILQESLACSKLTHFYVSFLLNANKFWNVLLRKAGYFDIEVQPWQEAGLHHFVRTLSMTAPLRSFPGLGHVRLRQTHQLSRPSPGLIVFDIRSVTEGETYSGTYEMWSRWEVEEREGECVVTVRQHTEHLRKSWITHVLEVNARDQTVIFLHKWLSRAKEQLAHEEKEALETERKKRALTEQVNESEAKVNDTDNEIGVVKSSLAVENSTATEQSGSGIDLSAILDSIPLPSLESLMNMSASMLMFALFSLFLIAGALYLSYAMSSADQRLETTSRQFSILNERAKFLLSFAARAQEKVATLRDSSLPFLDSLSFSEALANSWQEDWLPLEASWEVEEWQSTLSLIGSDVAHVAQTMTEEMALLAHADSVLSHAEDLHRISGRHQGLLRSLDYVRVASPVAAEEGYSYVTLLATIGTVAVGILYAAYA